MNLDARARRLRAPARRRHHPPPHDDLDGRLDPRHRAPRRARRCRSAWRCRCTPPTRRCARSSCRSTTATRSPTCSTPAARYYARKRRRVFVEYVMLAGVNDRYEQAARAGASVLDPRGLQGQPDPVQPDRVALRGLEPRGDRGVPGRARASTACARPCGSRAGATSTPPAASSRRRRDVHHRSAATVPRSCSSTRHRRQPHVAPHVRTRVTRGGRDADPAVVELVATMQRAASAAALVPFRPR